MEFWYKYSIIRVCPDPVRGEIVNIGLITISPDGEFNIHLSKNFNKVRTLDASFTDGIISELVDNMSFLAKRFDSVDEKILVLSTASKDIIRCSQFGGFGVNSVEDYPSKVSSLMNKLIYPSRKEYVPRSPRISTRMKNLFKRRNMLGNRGDIENHLVVPNFPIDDKSIFTADFALKNGAMHITQTIDFDTSDVSKKHGQAALNALTLDKAVGVFGKETGTYVIYSATAEKQREVGTHLDLLDEHTEHLYNIRSNEDMKVYFDIIEDAIEVSKSNI
ncbi:DUF3037 domain-containing protein [Marinobacterium jannaschii]|uniref:DUF3037 domain-containing protein n=1 Tax=Marinobacterium jannaschii TaxID=64970 RepID=UPI000485929E|nr:DUF3037 domain-containing protein [Marinobacterium jannaschii]